MKQRLKPKETRLAFKKWAKDFLRECFAWWLSRGYEFLHTQNLS